MLIHVDNYINLYKNDVYEAAYPSPVDNFPGKNTYPLA
jgi:hypothetical protein